LAITAHQATKIRRRVRLLYFPQLSQSPASMT
jgi:hypothetical protein